MCWSFMIIYMCVNDFLWFLTYFRLVIDYSSLPNDLIGLHPEAAKKTFDTLNRKLLDLHNLLVKIQAPNMKV